MCEFSEHCWYLAVLCLYVCLSLSLSLSLSVSLSPLPSFSPFLFVSLFFSSCVTSRFETLVNMCVEVLHDVMDLAEDDVIFE